MTAALLQMYQALPPAGRQELLDFATFLMSKVTMATPADKKVGFGSLSDKIDYISSDFDAPLAEMTEYMQ